MPTAQVTSHTTRQVLWTTPKNKKGQLTALQIDNQSAAARTIIISDRFTPDPSVGTPSPSEQIIDRQQVTVDVGLPAGVPSTELEGCEFLGVAEARGDAIDAACVIIAVYSLT